MRFNKVNLRVLVMMLMFTIVGSVFAKDVKWVAANQNYENGVQYPSATVNSDITLAFGDGANDGKYYTTGSGIRIYSKGKVTVTSSAKEITRIVVTYSGTSNTGTMAANVGTYDLASAVGTWEGSAMSVVFTNNASSGHARIQSIEVSYEADGVTVDNPTFDVTSGIYYGQQTISLSAAEGADIYYSTNGTDYEKYTTGVVVSEDATIYAYAQVGDAKSDVVFEKYQIAKSYASISEIWNVETNKQPVSLTLTNATITSVFVTAKGIRNGIYVTEGADTIEVFAAGVPEEWEEGGKVSGVVNGTWQLYNGTKEVCPANYSGLTYSAPVFEPVDVTSKIANPSFEDGMNNWNVVTAGIAKVSSGNGNKALSGNNVPFELNQTIEGLEPGVYTLKFQAFGRMKSNADSWADYLAGTVAKETNVFVYANDAQKEAMNVAYGAVASKVSGDWSSHTDAEGGTVYILNNSGAVADAFAQGMYEDELTGIIVGSDGKLLLGVKKTSDRGSDSHYNYYGGADNFRLYYNGPLKVTAAEVDALVATAPKGQMNAGVKSAMDSAIETLKAEKTAANYETASEAIKAATASAKAYSDVKAAIDAIETAKTTDAAKAEAKAAIAEIADNYTNGAIEGDGAAEVEAINAALTAAMNKAEAAETLAKLEALGAAGATATDPVDVTSVIANPSFTNGDKGWTWTTQGIAKVTNYGGNSSVTGNNNAFAISQTLKGMLPGKYVLKAQAFGRMKSNADSWTDAINGLEVEVGAYIFANDAKAEAKHIIEGAVATKGSGDYSTHEAQDGTTVYILNNSKAASEVFANPDAYLTEVEVIVGEDGVLEIGYAKTSSSTDYNRYGGCDNFMLVYYGEVVTPNTIVAGEYAVSVKIVPNDGYTVPAELQKYVLPGYDRYVTTGSIEGDETALTLKANEGLFNGVTIKGDAIAYGPTVQFVIEGRTFTLCSVDGTKTTGKIAIKNNGGIYEIEPVGVMYNGIFVGVVNCSFTLETPTAIDTIDATAKAGKIYNLNGQQLNSLQKGLNIVGGKKVMVK